MPETMLATRHFVKLAPDLDWAVITDQVEAARILLQYKANPEVRNLEGDRPYDMAAKFAKYEIGKILEEHTSPEGDKVHQTVRVVGQADPSDPAGSGEDLEREVELIIKEGAEENMEPAQKVKDNGRPSVTRIH
jgi:hypothetical protein